MRHPQEKENNMHKRITSPALIVPAAMGALQALGKVVNDAAAKAGIPQSTIDLIALRASQINGCAVCLDMHGRALEKAGETNERLFTLAAWRETPYFNDAERAALALTEAGTRIADSGGTVPDVVLDEAAKYYDDQALATLILAIANINSWNRLNVMSGQVTGDWVNQWVA
jgi:AhpD family alkylhydroperoxidase